MIAEVIAAYSGKLITILLAGIALFAAYFTGKAKEAAKRDRQEIKREAEHNAEVVAVKQETVAVKQQVEAIEIKQDEKATVARMSSSAVADRLRNEWSRD